MVNALVQLMTVLLILIISPLVIMLLWNWLMPMIFGLITLTYFQSIGLFILSNLLFKSQPYFTSTGK